MTTRTEPPTLFGRPASRGSWYQPNHIDQWTVIHRGVLLSLTFSTSISPALMAQELHDDACYVALTRDHLDAKAMMDRVRSPKAGAIVLFAGTFNPS